MPRTWSRRELEPQPATQGEAGRSSRYAARLLVAAVAIAAAGTLVATSTDAALLLPPPADGAPSPPRHLTPRHLTPSASATYRR